MQKSTARQSNIELLRIFAMVMIIAHHIGAHSGFDYSATMPVWNKIWIQFIQTGGKIGVNIFVLISGYFLICAKSLRLSKVAKLWVQLLTYSVGLYLLFVLLGEETFSAWALIGRFFPITNSSWWFAKTYFILFLLSPFINIGLNALGQKNHLRLLAVLTVLWCLIPTFFSDLMESSGLLWFIYLYALAGYIRLYVDLKRIPARIWFLAALALTAATFLLAFLLDLFGVENIFDPHSSSFFYRMQMLPVLLLSAAFFMAFLSKDMGCNTFVNLVSGATFGVYLLHDYADMRTLLWHTLFQNNQHQQDPLLIPYTLLQIVAVFAGCAIIDLLRIYLIENSYMKSMDSLIEKAKIRLTKLFVKQK